MNDWTRFGRNSISQSEYDTFKKEVKNNSIIRKIIEVSDLEIVSNTIIRFSGVEFEMTENAFKSLVKILGLSTGFMENISKKLGEKVSSKLLSMMKTAVANDTSSVCLLVNKKTSKIVGFTKSAESVLSNNAFFSLFEQTMNNHNGMEIKNMSITEHGNIEMTVLNGDWDFNVGGLSDEYFKSGLVFINTPDSTIINPFNERLTCTNGLEVSSSKGMSLILKKNDSESISSFFDAVTNLKGVENFEVEFKKRIIRMMDTVASFSEMSLAHKTLTNHVLNTTDPDVRANIESFIPLTSVKQAFQEHNIDLNMLSDKEHKKVKTMLTVWDLVNRLTDVSSHPTKYGLQLENQSSSVFELQRVAGDISFKNQYDLENPVKQIF